jgi:hypothetical protein
MVAAGFIESWQTVRAGFIESWIGVVDNGASITRIHDSANSPGPGVAGGVG